jgi:hypothetical protein
MVGLFVECYIHRIMQIRHASKCVSNGTIIIILYTGALHPGKVLQENQRTSSYPRVSRPEIYYIKVQPGEFPNMPWLERIRINVMLSMGMEESRLATVEDRF